jgi:urease accessory protein
VAGDGYLMSACAAANEVFAANRADGQISLAIAATPSGPSRTHLHESGSLRLRFPHSQTSAALDAVLVNTAGGMTGGDRFNLEIAVGAGAQLTVTTAAAEKIYRSLGPATEIAVRLEVGTNGGLGWLPQMMIGFDGFRLRRTVDVRLARNARLLFAEATVFGRSAMGEIVREGQLLDRRRVRVDGRLVFAEAIGLDGDIAQHLAQAAVTKRGVAIASVLKIPADEDCVAAVRSVQDRFAGDVGISAWNGLAMARLVAPDGASLQHDLMSVLQALGATPLPRLWLN